MNKISIFILYSILLIFTSTCTVRFSSEVVETFNFLIAVTIIDENKFEIVEAHLIVKAEKSKTVYECDLPSETSSIELNKNYSTYTLIITKEGFATWQSTFKIEELLKYEKEPLIVILNNNN